MFSRNCIGFSRECSPFKALEFMKNPSVSDKLEVSGEIKSRQSISKGISPSVLYFIGQHINLQVQALYCFSEGIQTIFGGWGSVYLMKIGLRAKYYTYTEIDTRTHVNLKTKTEIMITVMMMIIIFDNII